MTAIAIASILVMVLIAANREAITGRGRPAKYDSMPAPPAVPQSAEIDASSSEAGATSLVHHDPAGGAGLPATRSRTVPLSPTQVQRLEELFTSADQATSRAVVLLKSRAASPATMKKLQAAERSATLRSIALSEARAGAGFEVLDGPTPTQDLDWHMYTLPSPDKDNHMWVIPISKAKHPRIADLEKAYRSANRALDDEHCRTWNAMPFAQRQRIVEQAEAADQAIAALGGMLRELEAAGATQHLDYIQAKQQLTELQRQSGRRPLM